MNWNDLTMAQKNELMQTYIRNGVTSLDDMRSHFNTYTNGGPKKTYKEWAIQMHTKYPWLELNPNKAGYDYERYFNENYDDAIARLNEAEARHFIDRYKLPNHPTFSNESLYSQGPSYGGTWTKDDKFMPSVINQQQYPNIYNQNRAYTEEEIYNRLRHKFDEGGSKQNRYVAPRFPEEYQVLPVNEEGLPYYTLPDLEVTAERLPQAKATDVNIQRYANAVASGQLKLTQISNTELRNRVRAKPIVDQIMRDRDKTLAPILMGTVGMPAAIIGGISAAPTVAAIMNNPIVDAGLTIQGAVTAPRNIKEGVHEIREGKYGKGALDLGLTALDLYGGSKLIKHGKNVTKRAAESIMRMSSAPYREIKPMVNTLRDDYKYILFKGKPKFGDYTGVFNHTGEQINIPYQNDVISAYLYGNKLDPRLGKLVGYDKSLYGAHTNYIKRNYKRKMGRIPVYELGEPSEHIYPYLQEAIDLKEPTGLVGEMNTLKDGITINTSGHIVVPENIGVQKGAIEQDIWKFNPDDYRRRWDKKTNDFHGNDMNPISRFGLKILDKMGTPIIFKSKPIIP